MSSPATLPLSNLVNVIVYVSPQLPPQPTFNQGIIIGNSAHIPTATRVVEFLSLAAMAAYGFLPTDPEYIAASLYFSQSPAPQILWVGVQGAGETPLVALTACRNVNFSWWSAYVCTAQKADHIAIAQYMQTATPVGAYFYNTADADALAGTAGNVFLTIQAQKYNRTIGLYSTTQGGNAPNNAYSGAALMGVAMGLNTGLANSYFTLKFKSLVGVVNEPLTFAQVQTIENEGGNVYLNYGNAYSFFEQGIVGDGQFFDEILNLDMLASDFQYTLVNLLVSSPAIPLTDAGETQLIHGINAACERARARGFIGQGKWSGAPLFGLSTGDPLPNGYLVQAQSFNQQSAAARAQRQAMPIFVALLEAQAAHSITVGVYVQR